MDGNPNLQRLYAKPNCVSPSELEPCKTSNSTKGLAALEFAMSTKICCEIHGFSPVLVFRVPYSFLFSTLVISPSGCSYENAHR
jgi:hypothetical protein